MDDPIKAWAHARLDRLEARLDALERELDAMERGVDAVERELGDAPGPRPPPASEPLRDARVLPFPGWRERKRRWREN